MSFPPSDLPVIYNFSGCPERLAQDVAEVSTSDPYKQQHQRHVFELYKFSALVPESYIASQVGLILMAFLISINPDV